MAEQKRWKQRPENSTWGDYGPNDQLGRMNELTAAKVKQGIAEVKEGKLTAEQEKHYVALELRENMAEKIRARFPNVQTSVGDCQERLPFPDAHFDRVLAIHVLEHLPNLPAALREIRRVCHAKRAVFSVVIPCEGGFAYGLARKISAQRLFEKRYHQSYNWFIQREHINRPPEIMEALEEHFETVHRAWFPLVVPSINLNLCIGLTLRPRPGGTRNPA
jgi:ubiquinone/menaquinone biosynthesis C-methylase UbiE